MRTKIQTTTRRLSEHLPASDHTVDLGATQAIKLVQPKVLGIKPLKSYGVEPTKFIGFTKFYVVESFGPAEKKAGANIHDLAVVCELPAEQQLIDPNVGYKALPNFRGVYVSKAKSLRCYYFKPKNATAVIAV